MNLTMLNADGRAVVQIELVDAVGRPLPLEREWELSNPRWLAQTSLVTLTPGPKPELGLAITDCLVVPQSVPCVAVVGWTAGVDLKDGKGVRPWAGETEIQFADPNAPAGAVAGPRVGDAGSKVLKVSV